MRRCIPALVVTVLALAGCTGSGSSGRSSSVPTSGSPAPATVQVRASGPDQCGIISSGAAGDLLGVGGTELRHLVDGDPASAASDTRATCTVNSDTEGSLQVTTASGSSAAAAYMQAKALIDPTLRPSGDGSLPTPFVSTKYAAEAARYRCGASITVLDVTVQAERPIANIAAAVTQFTDLVRQRLAAARKCALTPAPYRPSVAGTVHVLAGDGTTTALPGVVAGAGPATPLGRVRAMTTAPDGSVYAAVTTLQPTAPGQDSPGGSDAALDGTDAELVRLTPDGRIRAVRLHDVAAAQGSVAGLPTIFVTDLTWHDGQLWAVSASGDPADQSALFHLDPATGQSDLVEPDLGTVESSSQHVTMSDTGTGALAEKWATAHWSAVTFDRDGPVLLDTTHRLVWHVTLAHARRDAAPFALAYATARPTALASDVPQLDRQGDPDPYGAEPTGTAVRPAVGLPDGDFVATAVGGRLVVVRADGSAGVRSATALANSNAYYSHPSTSSAPLLLSTGGTVTRVDQRSLTPQVVSADPRLPNGATTVHIATHYSTDPLAAGALNTLGSSGPLAWRPASIVLAVAAGNDSLLQLTAAR